ncbi:hypothetical protein AMTRI_Chr10g3930 [Amborella trichopoda]|uniref:Lipase n=1 Tax=Amborella trichopoda TaxID=13333 RepID=W1NM25_AMBTC|nr:triacylglycerol lipase 2 [Amborella trichopoda]ERM96922.1 hypothetical protein AMTR_s00074p00126160 [Amborella trichopoda]|eukprot:XP_020517449.1 triacylglycerol lipase 2 [Amborella trichopoda]
MGWSWWLGSVVCILVAISHGGAAGVCEEVIKPKGYQCQEHTMTTKDGYILSLQRISQGRTPTPSNHTRQPVLLQHGLTMDGVSWLISPPGESLAFVLADNGFDVWISNTRGTKWSRKHTTLDPSDPGFWAWSWDELAEYDIPALFEYVNNQTGKKVNYVGHSLGTLIALASFSQGKAANLTRSAAFLSPIAYLSHMTTPLVLIASRTMLGQLAIWMGIAEFNIALPALKALVKGVCMNPHIDCFNMVSAITGKNCCLNSSTIELFLQYEPQSTSTRNMVHLAQMIKNGDVAKYDYGNPNENMIHYSQSTPPKYNMSNIPRDLPLFFSHGGYDALSDVEDVNLLIAHLDSHDKDKITIQFVDNYAHVDFILSVNAKQVVYEPLIDFLKRH